MTQPLWFPKVLEAQSANCGCVIREYASGFTLTQCALHEHAQELLEACEAADHWLSEELNAQAQGNGGQVSPREILAVLGTALAKVPASFTSEAPNLPSKPEE